MLLQSNGTPCPSSLDMVASAARDLPDELSGICKRRGTADALGSLCSALEDANFNQKTMCIVFLDVSRAFDTLLHTTILNQLRLNVVHARIFAFIEYFLKDRFWSVTVCGVASTPRPVLQGVPQGSVQSLLFFNIVMAALPKALPASRHLQLRIPIYADDIALWFVRSFVETRAIQKFL